MPGLLAPTNPVPGYEVNQSTRIPTPVSPGDTSVQNIVDPSRVVRPDAKGGEQQDTGDALGSYAARYESNFMTFLQRLRGAQQLPEVFMRLLQGQATVVSSGISSGFAAEMSQFMEFLEMDEAQLMDFLRNQIESGSRFTGPLFQTLRDAYGNTQSDLVQTEILQFLRRFSDYSSTPHLEEKMQNTVREMTQSLPSPWTGRLAEVLGKLENAFSAGDRAGALQLMREQVFPMIAQYVSQTHDHGRARALLSMLTLDVARYENGSEPQLLQAFRHLATNGVLPRELSDLSDEEIIKLLRNSVFFKASESNAFAERLANVTNRALQGEGGTKTQEAFHNIMTSTLINESVYMPLQHLMIPLEWNGQFMFSEMWIDRDAERSSKEVAAKDGTVRLLIKMDVESLGSFDLLFNEKNKAVSVQVACPKSVAPFSEEVGTALETILRRNGLDAGMVSVSEMKRPLTVSEVFPKLLERMRGVNVKV